MTKVQAKYDQKEKDEVESQKAVNTIVFESLNAREGGKWKEADEVHRLRWSRGYLGPRIKEMFRSAYCKFYKVEWKNKSKNEDYVSMSANLQRIIMVGCLEEKRYALFRNSERSVFSVWQEIVTSKRKMDNINKGKTTPDHKGYKPRKQKKNFIEQLKQDVAEGVENTKELLEGAVEMEKSEKVKVEENEGIHEYVAPDEDSVWIRTCRNIVREDPPLFIRMIKSLVSSDLLSNETLESVKIDLGG